jgi:hypothetical protein
MCVDDEQLLLTAYGRLLQRLDPATTAYLLTNIQTTQAFAYDMYVSKSLHAVALTMRGTHAIALVETLERLRKAPEGGRSVRYGLLTDGELYGGDEIHTGIELLGRMHELLGDRLSHRLMVSSSRDILERSKGLVGASYDKAGFGLDALSASYRSFRNNEPLT